MGTTDQMLAYKKKMRMHISKSLNIIKSWDALGPIVAEHIAGPQYSPIPYVVDTNAYQIGNIFIQEPAEVNCFCAAPVLKILGPLRDFVVRKKTDSRWLDKDIHAIKSTGDYVNFKVEVENSKSSLRYKAYDCYFLEKAPDMLIKGNVTIDRSSHEDLSRVDWFGLITGVVVADVSEMLTAKGIRERVFYIGEKPHNILFKDEVCKVDDNGNVYETSTERLECKWLPVRERDLDSLPLTEFKSLSTKVNS